MGGWVGVLQFWTSVACRLANFLSQKVKEFLTQPVTAREPKGRSELEFWWPYALNTSSMFKCLKSDHEYQVSHVSWATLCVSSSSFRCKIFLSKHILFLLNTQFPTFIQSLKLFLFQSLPLFIWQKFLKARSAAPQECKEWLQGKSFTPDWLRGTLEKKTFLVFLWNARQPAASDSLRCAQCNART